MSRPLYDVLLVAHVAAAVVGFGALAVLGLEASAGRRSSHPGADAGLRRFFSAGTDWAGRTIYLVPVLGLALLLGGDRSAVGHVWPWAGLAIWLAATGVASGLCWPAERKAQRALAGADAGSAAAAGADEEADEGAGEAADDEAFRRACARAERGCAVTSLLFVAAVAVMILQPG